jgi:predicted phage terminase large subunit-like protein
MITPIEARAELLRRAATRDLLPFLTYCWWMPMPLRIGRHTRAICARLTRAVDDYVERGKTTYLIVTLPFRHGKSDIISRALPPFFLGRCAAKEPNIIMSGYGASLIEGFSSKAQEIVRSEAYRRVFPSITIAGKASAAEWSVNGSQSTVYATGLGGAITGKGGNLITLDDYCKNREEAESKPIREKMWNSFKDDLMTRLNAGGGIVVVCATRWHNDDIIGRIKDAMDKDEDFPRFEELVFPARLDPDESETGEGWEILFPELYDADWYRKQRAQLGPYSAAALLDCNPVTSETAAFKEEWIADTVYTQRPPRNSMNIYAFVDGANSKKKDSDFTTMWVIGLGEDGNYYLLDCVHDRMDLDERTKAIIRLHRKWRPIAVFWEQVGCMSDVAHIKYVQNKENYRFPLVAVPRGTKDNKRARILRLQALFSQRRIWLPQYGEVMRVQHDGQAHDVIKDFVDDEYLVWPNSKHDDMLDPLADVLDDFVAKQLAWPETRESEEDEGDADADDGMFAR